VIQLSNIKPKDLEYLLTVLAKELVSNNKGDLDYGVRWTEFDNNDRIKTKERFFKSESQRSKFIEKLEAKDNFKEIKAYSNPNKKGVEASYRGEPEDLDILEMLENEWMVPVDIEDIPYMRFKVRDIGVYLVHPGLGEDSGPGGITVTQKMLDTIGMSMDQFIHWLVANDADDKTNAPRDTKYDNFYAANE